MGKPRGKHLTLEDREVIEAGLRNGKGAREIAREVGASASTVTREVKTNRTVREPRAASVGALALRCENYRACVRRGTACERCSTSMTACKACKTVSCTGSCPDYARRVCPETSKWPYTCPEGCRKRGRCGYPKCSYTALAADESYKRRLSSSREGICLSADELGAMRETVGALAAKGQSFEAIWAEHGGEMPVSVRTAYNYQADGLLGVADIDLPAKVRRRPRKKPRRRGGDRVDRTGRTCADFEGLPIGERVFVVQGDSVCGLEGNSSDILSLFVAARGFQGYFLKRHGDPASTVACLDAIELACGSREAFERWCPILLVDRGVEFDDWEGMERSCLEPGARRTRVFYCDPMESNQKSGAERHHQLLRRILPKGRSDFDKLSCSDVAEVCSHVNSYPLPKHGGRCGLELVGDLIEREALEALGIERVAADDVVMRPSLVEHAVER